MYAAFDIVADKVVKGFKRAREEKKLAGEKELELEWTTGREMNVSIINGAKSSYLYGFKEIANGLGHSDGDKGKEGFFKFDHMGKEAFNRTKETAKRISQKTINDMMVGNAQKFAKKNIRNIIKQGLAAGKSDEEIAKGIRGFFGDAKQWKVDEIIRTEIPMAYNMGRIDAAKKDGIKKARIELGGRPCSWCVDNFESVKTIDQAYEYMNAHHPNNDCTVVPLIDFNDYDMTPPEGYYGDDTNPVPIDSGPKVTGASNIAKIAANLKVTKKVVDEYTKNMYASGWRPEELSAFNEEIDNFYEQMDKGMLKSKSRAEIWAQKGKSSMRVGMRESINETTNRWLRSESYCGKVRESSESLYKLNTKISKTSSARGHLMNRLSINESLTDKPNYLVRGMKIDIYEKSKVGDILTIKKPSSFTKSISPSPENIVEQFKGKTSLVVKGPKNGAPFHKLYGSFAKEKEIVSKGKYKIISIKQRNLKKYGQTIVTREIVLEPI